MKGALALLILAPGLTGCVSPTSSPDPGPPGKLISDTDAIVRTLDILDGTLGPIEEPDISMAWQDLNRDLRSLVDEAVREPHNTDLDGVSTRIEGFRSRFESHEAMEATETHWDRLSAALEGLRNRLAGTAAGTPQGGPVLGPRT